MSEKTFVFIKPPNSVSNGEQILSHLEYYLTDVVAFRRLTLPKLAFPSTELLEAHYANCRNEPFFKKMMADFHERGIVAAIYEGDDIVKKVLLATGPTDPVAGQSWQLRRKYSLSPVGKVYSPDGCDSLEAAKIERRYVYNVIHRSGSPEEALKEIELWMEFMLKNGIYQPIK